MVPIVQERASAPGQADYKTRLQEVLAQKGQLPRYEITEVGPDHAKRFTAELWAGSELLGAGEGSSKKPAEQAAARAASILINQE